MSVYAALAQAQAGFPQVSKDANNPHFNKKYASLAGLVEAVRGPLTTAGLTFFHRLVDGGVETVIADKDGNLISSGPIQLLAGKQDMQGYGSAITYAKRYGLQMVTGIVADEDDDGNAAVASQGKSKPAQRKPSMTPPPKSLDEQIAACTTPLALTTLLKSWMDKKKVGSDPASWTKIAKTALVHTGTKVGANAKGWESAMVEPLNKVMDEITKALETTSQVDALFDKAPSSHDGGL